MSKEKHLNELAREFYKAHGYKVEKGYNFEKASHPQERGMYNLAVIAWSFFENITGLDFEDKELQDEEVCGE